MIRERESGRERGGVDDRERKRQRVVSARERERGREGERGR